MCVYTYIYIYIYIYLFFIYIHYFFFKVNARMCKPMCKKIRNKCESCMLNSLSLCKLPF